MRAPSPAARRNDLAAPGGTLAIVPAAAAVAGAVVLITDRERDEPDSN